MDEMNQNHNQMPSQQPSGDYGLSIASMVLGIVSLVLYCLPSVNILCGTISIIFGGISIAGKKPGKGMAIAGLVCSIVGISFYILFRLTDLSLDNFGYLF